MEMKASYSCSYCGGALPRPLLVCWYEPLQSADLPQGVTVPEFEFLLLPFFNELFTDVLSLIIALTVVPRASRFRTWAQAGFPSLADSSEKYGAHSSVSIEAYTLAISGVVLRQTFARHGHCR